MYTDGPVLSLKGVRNTVHNNYFYHIDWSTADADGTGSSMWLQGANNVVTKNTVHEFGASECITSGSSARYEYNHIHDGAYLTSGEGGVLYPYDYNSVQNPDTVIGFNWVHDVDAFGIVLEDGGPPHDGRNNSVHHNVVFNTKGVLIKGDEHFIYKNTVFNTNTNNGIIVESKNEQNFLTETLDNVSDGISSLKTEISELSGFSADNLDTDSATIQSQLMDPEQFNFCPIPGSEISSAGVGAYDRDCEDQWEAGITWEFITPELPPWE